MSLPPPPLQRSIFDVQNLIGREFDPADRFRLFQEKVYPSLLAARKALTACYCRDNGRPAEEPVMLLGATVLQFMERVPDRLAAESVKYHLGWKLALGLELSPEAFHPTTLCTFRERLLNHKAAKVAFDAVLEGLIGAGLVSRRSNQRLDSTHVLGLVAKMSRLECVRETMRLTLAELGRAMAAMDEALRPVLPAWWPLMWERYVESKLDYRMEVPALVEKMTQAGQDAWELLQWLEALRPGAPEHEALARGEKALLLARVFGENFEAPAAPADAVKQRPAQPATAVKNPHEPQAQWSTKGNRSAKGSKPEAKAKSGIEWVGYKIQVAETVQDEPRDQGEPTASFLTSIETQPANGSDEAGMVQTLEAQEQSGLEPPPQLYVDGAYVSAAEIKKAELQGRELVGPAQPATNKATGFKSEVFEVDVENRTAVCPAGHASTSCSRLEEKATGKVSFRFEWGGKGGPCKGCPLHDQCISLGQTHRTLNVSQNHSHLQQRRREMQTGAFKEKMKRRNAIEATQSELVRGHGARRARYRGEEKVRLQNYFIGAACNAKRWARRIAWEMKQAAKAAAAAMTGALRPEETAAATV